MGAFETFRPLVETIAARYGYPAALLAAQAEAESNWNPNARSGAGAVGIMQFMQPTWDEWGNGDPTDPAASLDAGVNYMQHLLGQFPGLADQVALALASYNWGLSRVQALVDQNGRSDWAFLQYASYVDSNGKTRKVPQETRDYVKKIQAKVITFKSIFQSIVPDFVQSFIPGMEPSTTADPGIEQIAPDQAGFIAFTPQNIALIALAGLLGLVLLRRLIG